jgi:ribosomal-protein-alanine N-acetyltransferase
MENSMLPHDQRGAPEPSERLVFRTWTENDLPFAITLWTDADVMRHMGGARSAEQAAERLRDEMSAQQTYGFQYWPIFKQRADGTPGEHAGCAGLRLFHGSLQALEVGVHIARPLWSGRYGEEAARAVIAHAWQYTGAKILTAGHGPDNANSKALIERLGFTYTHHEPWGPHNRMHPYYQLIKPAK